MKPKRYNKQKDILFILISSFIVVVAWIGFNIYHIWITSTVSQELQLELTPIAPTFDAATMQQLKARKGINPSFTLQSVASQSAQTPTIPLPTPKQLVTPTPVISEAPSGVQSQPSSQPTSSSTQFNLQGQ